MAESLAVRTVRQDTTALEGSSVTFEISSLDNPARKYAIFSAFSANRLGLAEQTYPVEFLQKHFQHLRDLPLPALDIVQPLVLIGADYLHLINPIERVHFGPPTVNLQMQFTPVRLSTPGPSINPCL